VLRSIWVFNHTVTKVVGVFVRFSCALHTTKQHLEEEAKLQAMELLIRKARSILLSPYVLRQGGGISRKFVT
jgi:hypothetical protein